MRISEIWRYPVKSMAGEMLDEVNVDLLGLEGDRVVHVEDFRGRWITSRTHPRLLGHRATWGPSRAPLVDGRPWTDPGVERDIVEVVGSGGRLVYDAARGRFDVLPLLIATDGAVRAFGYDGRRLRPNLVIAGVDGLDERSWPGSILEVGSVRIGIQSVRDRCVMTTYDPDTLVQDLGVLKTILSEFGGKLALDAFVIEGGRIRVGDEVKLVPAEEATRASGSP